MKTFKYTVLNGRCLENCPNGMKNIEVDGDEKVGSYYCVKECEYCLDFDGNLNMSCGGEIDCGYPNERKNSAVKFICDEKKCQFYDDETANHCSGKGQFICKHKGIKTITENLPEQLNKKESLEDIFKRIDNMKLMSEENMVMAIKVHSENVILLDNLKKLLKGEIK